MKSFRETEKAIELELVLDFYNVEKTVTKKVWIPKSQIRDGKVTAWIVDKKSNEVAIVYSRLGGFDATIRDADGKRVCIDGRRELTEAEAKKCFNKIQKALFGF